MVIIMTTVSPSNALNSRQAEALPIRGNNNQKRVEEEARSVHTDRHYDKSARSGNSQEKSVKSQASQERSVHSQRSQVSQEKAPSDNRSQKSGSQRKEGSASSNRTGEYRYKKLSSSLVSNPDNLVCDDCINKGLGKNKKDRENAHKDADKEYVQKTNAYVRQQLELEKQKHLEKLQMYKEGIDEQNMHLKAMKGELRTKEAMEKERIRLQMADNSDLVAQERMKLEKKEKFRSELDEQLDVHYEKIRINQQYKLDAERANHNLLIDDAWRGPMKAELKQHYKHNLLAQMNDNEQGKLNLEKDRKAKDAQYVEDVKGYNQRDYEAKLAIELEKKELFKQELAKQLNVNEQKRQQDLDLKGADDQQHKDRIEIDNMHFRSNMEKKKIEVHGYLVDLTEQARLKEHEKRLLHIESKKVEGTGLHLPQKVKKCYNCNNCKNNHPLERMNKKYQVKSRAK